MRARTLVTSTTEATVIKHMSGGGSRVLSLIVEGPIEPHSCPEQPAVSVSGAPDVCLRVFNYEFLAINFYMRKISSINVFVWLSRPRLTFSQRTSSISNVESVAEFVLAPLLKLSKPFLWPLIRSLVR